MSAKQSADKAPAPIHGTTAPIAPLHLRVIARAVDYVLAGFIASACARGVLPLLLSPEEFVAEGIFDVRALLDALDSPLFWAISIAATTVWEVAWLLYEGATPGKQLCGLFVHDPGSPIGTVRVWPAVKRNVHRLVLIVPFGFVGVGALTFASLVLMVNDAPRRQSVMDRFAHTTVHRLKGSSPRFSPWVAVFLVSLFAIRLVALVVVWWRG